MNWKSKGEVKLYRLKGFSGTDLSDKSKVERASGDIDNAMLGRTYFSDASIQDDYYDSTTRYEDSSIEEVKSFFKISHEVGLPFPGYVESDFPDQNDELAKEVILKARRDWPLWGKYLVSCFTIDCGINKLWGGYSSSHHGFAFEFSARPYACTTSELGPMRYVNECPVVTTVDVLHVAAEGAARGLVPMSDEKRKHIDLIRTPFKGREYEDNREWRSIRSPLEKAGFHSVLGARLTGVLFGARASDDLVSFVKGRLPSDMVYYRMESDVETRRMKKVQMV